MSWNGRGSARSPLLQLVSCRHVTRYLVVRQRHKLQRRPSNAGRLRSERTSGPRHLTAHPLARQARLERAGARHSPSPPTTLLRDALQCTSTVLITSFSLPPPILPPRAHSREQAAGTRDLGAVMLPRHRRRRTRCHEDGSGTIGMRLPSFTTRTSSGRCDDTCQFK
ncbi:hypothetical protein MRX96_037708 [Rhipicephalus microplus]